MPKTTLKQSDVFALFLTQDKLKFSDIEKQLHARSNKISYHITQMQKQGILEKKGLYYSLTTHAEKMIPLFSELSATISDIGPLPVILVAVTYKNKILLVKRNKRPYKDYWSMIGGKMLHHETVQEASLRKVQQKTGLQTRFVSVNALLHERVHGDDVVKHSFLLLFTKVESSSIKFHASASGELKWFDFEKINSLHIIPSDKLLIETHLHKKLPLKQMVLCEKSGIIESSTLVR